MKCNNYTPNIGWSSFLITWFTLWSPFLSPYISAYLPYGNNLRDDIESDFVIESGERPRWGSTWYGIGRVVVNGSEAVRETLGKQYEFG